MYLTAEAFQYTICGEPIINQLFKKSLFLDRGYRWVGIKKEGKGIRCCCGKSSLLLLNDFLSAYVHRGIAFLIMLSEQKKCRFQLVNLKFSINIFVRNKVKTKEKYDFLIICSELLFQALCLKEAKHSNINLLFEQSLKTYYTII